MISVIVQFISSLPCTMVSGEVVIIYPITVDDVPLSCLIQKHQHGRSNQQILHSNGFTGTFERNTWYLYPKM